MGHSSTTTQPNYGTGKKTFASYFGGFLLCILLTLIPFYAVIHQVGTRHQLLAILFVTAILQFFIQVTCFLRLNRQSEQGRMNILSFIFTGVVAVIVIGGSLWIMTNLNYFMVH